MARGHPVRKSATEEVAWRKVDTPLASDGTSRRVGRVQVAAQREILEQVAELTALAGYKTRRYQPGNSHSFAAARLRSCLYYGDVTWRSSQGKKFNLRL